MLSLIILSLQCVIGEQFDTYLEPLVEELKLLLEVGILVRNTTQFNCETHFNLRAILMWTMHDLLAYGLVVGCITKRYQGCPCCGLLIMTHKSQALWKNVYCS
jgi:hypothetical protein